MNVSRVFFNILCFHLKDDILELCGHESFFQTFQHFSVLVELTVTLKKNKKKNTTTYHTRTHTHSGKDDSGFVLRTVRSLPAYAWAWLRSCMHVCRSAKALMPKQLVGWSWDCRNSQQTWRTSISWRRLAAGRRTCKDDTHIINLELQLDFMGERTCCRELVSTLNLWSGSSYQPGSKTQERLVAGDSVQTNIYHGNNS